MDDNHTGASVPIPTYDEAIAARPPSSHSFLGPQEISNDAEREGLLENQGAGGSSAPQGRYPRGYQPPTVESVRSSLDYLADAVDSHRDSEESLRREMQEMEIMDPPQPQSQMGALISKRISSLTSGLSSLNFPFRDYLTSVRWKDIRLPPLPDELKPSWILFVRVVGALLVVGVGYLLFFSDLVHFSSRAGYSIPIDQISEYVLANINVTNIRNNLEHATRFDHVAGTEGSFFLAKWLEAEMKNSGWEDVQLERFDVYMNYPKPNGRSVAIVAPEELAWTAVLEEELAYTNPPREQTSVFHGYSKSGNATGPLIYANFGSQADFDKLKDLGVDVTGAVVLVRYYGTQSDRALKVKAAQSAGAAGCIIYSDPQQDGFVKGPVYPEGPERPRDGVQRGSVALTAWIAGDPLSPGFASLPNEQRRGSSEDNPALAKIPSLPIAWRDAQHLLASLKGKGSKLSDASWIGGVPDTEWWTGSRSSPTIHLQNEQDVVDRQPIYNVLGQIKGREQSEKKVILGNHYDAWCFGATDPGSGTAILTEMIRVFGELRGLGWQPRRTIEIGAWDAEEYNLIGSTEHVEARLDDLRRDGFAYVNIDVGVGGRDFHAAGSPLLQRILYRVLNRVGDPATGKTLRALWEADHKQMEPLGAGSDYVAFQDFAGTSSIDLTFGGQNELYHSCYDGFEYMARIGDPEFAYHRAMAQVVALLVIELADEPMVPFDLEAYASTISAQLDVLAEDAAESLGPDFKLSLDNLRHAQADLAEKAGRLRAYMDGWMQMVESMGGFESAPMTTDRMRYNAAMATFESNLLDLEQGVGQRFVVSTFPSPIPLFRSVLVVSDQLVLSSISTTIPIAIPPRRYFSASPLHFSLSRSPFFV